jgi:hypothetical protein
MDIKKNAFGKTRNGLQVDIYITANFVCFDQLTG